MNNSFTDPEFMSDPFKGADQLRDQAALVQVKLPVIGKVWVTTTQAALGIVLKDTETFSLRKHDGRVTGVQWWMPKAITLLANNMLTMDDPDHARLRGLVDKAFRRDFIMGLEPRIQTIADNMATRLFDERDTADLVHGFARKFPLAVICELLGIREKDRAVFANWAESLTSIDGMISFLRAVGPIRKMRLFVSKEIERQRSAPENGLIGQLVEMQSEGAEISDDELIAMVFLLLIAGHETTTHVISGGVLELLRSRQQKEWLLGDASHIPLAVEEILRFVSAVQFAKPRNVRSDVEIEGVKLKKGDVVMAMIVAANGDPSVIHNPHEFDLSRKPNRHVSFGAGPHFCLGHQLARLEIACALKALFSKHPNLGLAVDESKVKWKSRIGIRIVEALPVKSS